MVINESSNTVFVDSDAFIALYDPDDPLHNRATKVGILLQKQKLNYITGINILLEVSTMLSQRIGHKLACEFLDTVRKDAEIVYLDEAISLKAEELFRRQTSKNVSYSDCVSFTIMKEQDIKLVFSFDRDFRKNGFELIEEVLKN